MKKTRKIQLILITAALASCNREWVPRKSVMVDPADSTLTMTPAGGVDPYGDPYDDPLDPCNCMDPYSRLWNYSFNPFGVYYFGPVGPGIYHRGNRYGKGAFWRSNHVVIRGGLGKSAYSGGA